LPQSPSFGIPWASSSVTAPSAQPRTLFPLLPVSGAVHTVRLPVSRDTIPMCPFALTLTAERGLREVFTSPSGFSPSVMSSQTSRPSLSSQSPQPFSPTISKDSRSERNACSSSKPAAFRRRSH
ncbi:unnamed protein product, partial [Ectocarpus sp. 12 AP-2014]